LVVAATGGIVTTAAPPTSLVEIALTAMARGMARRREARARRGTPSAIAEYVTGILGTLLAMGCLTVAAFTVGFALGFTVAGIALLLLDFKAAVVRRARHARGRR
jgi:hypothetical protein